MRHPDVVLDHPCERVLLVNHDAEMLETMREVLELRGMAVETARSSSEADRVLDGGFQPSVVVIDLVLGDGVRGDHYAQRLRADARFASVPLVVMSGANAPPRWNPGITLLPKPFDIEKLYALLGEICEEHGRR